MTYCVGILLKDGLVMAADSRTNAGVDQIATFRKMTVFEQPGERVMVLLAAGNLATSQSVVSLVSERLGERRGEASLFRTKTMFNAARIVGRTLRDVVETDGEYVRAQGAEPGSSFLLGGQIRGRPSRLFQIYEAGNFIEATPETPFLQIGETKYGKPILDRTVSHGMPIEGAARSALLSFNSTMRSNVSVAPPIDIVCYRRDSLKVGAPIVVAEDDPYFANLSQSFAKGIAELVETIPAPPWRLTETASQKRRKPRSRRVATQQ